MIYNKLVRDKIPEIIAESGKSVTFRVLSDEEYKIALEKKLDEEVAEFHKSKSIEELTDIFEVFVQLCYAYEHSVFSDVKETAYKKRLERGGFDKKIFLEEVKEND